MTDLRELMKHHIDALFTHNARMELLHVNEPNGARAPRFFLGRTADGPVLRFRDDLADGIRRALQAAADDDANENSHTLEPAAERYTSILTRVAPVQKTWIGPAFACPPHAAAGNGAVRITEANAELLRAFFEGWISDLSLSQPMFAVVADNHAVSLCCSVRQTNVAHEAGVETATAYRGRGYAAQVVAAWARAVRDEQRLPLYSTSLTNDGSRAVAEKLGLTLLGYDLHIT